MADELFVADGHVDLLYDLERRGLTQDFAHLRQGPVTPETLAAGGVRLLVCALYCEDVFNGPGTALARLEELRRRADGQLAALARVRRRDDLGNLEAPAAMFLLENGDALLDADLDALQAWGLKVVGLTHAGRNRLADGNGVAVPEGLSAAGRGLLRALARRGWIIDTAHLSAPAFGEVVRDYPGALICSHTGLRPFCDRQRNLSEWQAAALIERGGIIGLTLAPEMLNGGTRAARADLVPQIDWLVQRFGWQVVALGSDYGGFDGVCAGLESYAHWPLLAADLQALGYPEEAVAGILGENWRRFYRETLP
ncbi:dipeptidase [Geoalkalibacter halelectricus]|uniref:Membrane dipeptidase n=1 Tax=Geoalkalibacter halelectricus TaxID=2847045 RepID=A0ABY5ZIT5_9BACT|nr:membrane dipeptidase [Geoalkalibacter halelectricus]MDO3378927.1 membrane dipeptidase [Geoalkalibacter halelectricus]UWZ79050.1 membrane dipeptidase [Geoalkalibacter halelectricus]